MDWIDPRYSFAKDSVQPVSEKIEPKPKRKQQTAKPEKAASAKSLKPLVSQVKAALAQPLDVWTAAFGHALAGLKWPQGCGLETSFLWSAVMREQAEFTDTVDRLCGEHEELDRMLHAVRGGDLGGVDAFVDALRHHIDREDNGLFPASAVGLSGADWDRVLEQTPPAVQAGATAGR